MLRSAGSVGRRLYGAAVQPAAGLSGVRLLRNAVELDGWNTARSLLPFGDAVPTVAVDAWVAPNATVVGDVQVADRASVWYGAVLRGDLAPVRLGAFSSLGDRAVISTARSVPTGLSPATVIGRHVTIGAGSLLRSVVVEDEVAIGQRCVLMEGAVVESGAVLADGTVVPPGRRIPGKQLWAGSPARYVRDVSYDEAHEITDLAKSIGALADAHGDQLLPEQDMNAFKDAAALKAALQGST